MRYFKMYDGFKLLSFELFLFYSERIFPLFWNYSRQTRISVVPISRNKVIK